MSTAIFVVSVWLLPVIPQDQLVGFSRNDIQNLMWFLIVIFTCVGRISCRLSCIAGVRRALIYDVYLCNKRFRLRFDDIICNGRPSIFSRGARTLSLPGLRCGGLYKEDDCIIYCYGFRSACGFYRFNMTGFCSVQGF